ncbi:MAG TPA: RnfH family protein [Lysobacter sp.]
MRVELVRAWPRHHESIWLDLPEDATLADAFTASGWETAPAAVFGERARADRPLENGDRIEVLRPLIADPKDARRRRARGAAG